MTPLPPTPTIPDATIPDPLLLSLPPLNLCSALGRQVVLSINGRSCIGMTSFDALEAIQGDGDTVVMAVQSAGGGEKREVSLKKTFITRDPVSSRLVTADDGSKVGYIKLSEFNAQCKRRVRQGGRRQ